jgi:uncharacterized protein YprB with RNaseH-like and TPR domain
MEARVDSASAAKEVRYGTQVMLERTFVHIQGIGAKTEKHLWKRGIVTWDRFLNRNGTVFSEHRDRFVDEELTKSLAHRHDVRFFEERLSSVELWRLYESFRTRAVFLDIETSGGCDGFDEITMIGIYDGQRGETFLNGDNLLDFEKSIASFDLLITYNGSSFDVPFIRRSFPGITLPPVHIDLRPLLGRLGYRGGLKRIEKQAGLARDPSIAHMDGYDAVKLWYSYQSGDASSLGLLKEYNRADTVNLKPLMELASEKMKDQLLR